MLIKVKSLINNISNKGFFHLLTANFFIQILGFGTQLFVVKFLKPSEMADIKVIQSYINVIIILAGFGFNTAVLKICSEEQDVERKRAVLKRTVVLSLFSSIAVILGFVILIICGFLGFGPNLKKWIIVYLLSVPAMVYTTLFMQYLQSQKKIKKMAKIQSYIKAMSFCAVITFTYFYGFKGFIITTVVVFYLSVLPLVFNVKEDLLAKSAEKNIHFKELYSFSIYSCFSNLLNAINGYMDIFLLNMLVSDRLKFGYYSIATIFILGLNQITGTVQSIATPYLSEKSKDKEEFKRVLYKYQKLLIILALILSLIASLAVPFIIKIIYGSKYALVGRYFNILVWRYFIWSCYAVVSVAIIGLGKMNYNLVHTSLGLFISSISGYLLITTIGIYGAALSQIITALIILPVQYYIITILIKKN